jgi:uncharacterized membrane protein YeaQ/YmgE (transglycosylase-associated protein family)
MPYVPLPPYDLTPLRLPDAAPDARTTVSRADAGQTDAVQRRATTLDIGAAMIGNIIAFFLLGLVAGAIARLLVPGRDRLGLLRTAVLGMIGSFVGGFLGYLVGHDKGEGGLQASGIFGSIVGSVIVLLLYRRFGKKRLAKH